MLIFTGCSAAPAAPGVDEAVAAGVQYYANHSDTWEEALAAAAVGVPVTSEDCEALIVISDQAIPTGTLAGYVCLLTAAGIDAKLFAGANLAAMLADRQQDGSFGFLYETVFSALALEGAGADYDVDGLLRHLIASQRADGSFEDMDTTGLALSLLSTIDDERAKTMADRAAAHLRQAEIDDAALPCAVIGLTDTGEKTDELVERLTPLQGEDGSFSDPMALVALDAVKEGGSVFVRHATDTAMVLISIQHGGDTVVTGRIEADAEADALTLTKRFCAKQGIDIVVVEGQVRQIGQYSGSWKLAEGASTAAGGSITWIS
ncbi:MAG TPA: hypothetical protein VN446_07000 [Candidatus Acidoferrum sp.]|nr:hypothetical protein [Candidatus Acidoferrum sp.]